MMAGFGAQNGPHPTFGHLLREPSPGSRTHRPLPRGEERGEEGRRVIVGRDLGDESDHHVRDSREILAGMKRYADSVYRDWLDGKTVGEAVDLITRSEGSAASDSQSHRPEGDATAICGSCLEPADFLVLGLCQACADFHGFSPTSS